MDRTVWGYCRVSSVDQNLDRQKAAMLADGIDEKHILCDKASGKDFERRTWNLLVGTDTSAPLLRKGDLLVVLSLDRLGRNYTEIRKQWAYITTEIGADIKVLDMPAPQQRTLTNASLQIWSCRFLATPPRKSVQTSVSVKRKALRSRAHTALRWAAPQRTTPKIGRPCISNGNRIRFSLLTQCEN